MSERAPDPDAIETIRGQRAFLRQVIDINPNLIFVKDRLGRFTLVNQALADVYGTTVDSIVGKTDADFNPNLEEVEWFRRDDLEVMNSLKEKFITEEIITDSKGNRRHLQTIKRPVIDADGIARHVLGVATDVTLLKLAEKERRDMQAQVLHAQKLESLGVLAGGIAHDFNNLMVGVLGNAELAASKLQNESEILEIVERVSMAATRAADLCKQLLAYSGRGRFVLEAINLSEVVHEMTDLLRVSINKKATLVQDLAAGLPAVEADPTQVRQVIMNLITNASDALEDGPGTVGLRTGRRDCDETFLKQAFASENAVPGSYCFVEVRDTGMGMDEEIVNRIFDPFFSTKFTGRGLGLAAVLGIVSGHGGAIHYSTSKGQGTTVQVFFPQSSAKAATAEVTSSLSPSSQKPKVALIIDDEPIVREVLCQLLASAGFATLPCATGNEGLAVWRDKRNDFSIVLLDLTMPDKSGTEVLREIRQLHRSQPVLLLSGYSEDEALRDCRDDRHLSFLQKPFKGADLLNRIASLLATTPQ